MANTVSKMLRTVAKTKQRLVQQSKQRRGGVTDLYALDYVGEINNLPEGWEVLTGKNQEGKDVAENDTSTESRIATLVQAIKANVQDATAEGIAGIIGNFGVESDVTAKRYEADYATGYKYDTVEKDPTAEGLMGSWGGFLALYGGTGLNQAGYQSSGKHWIGIGLGQWTGVRGEQLYNFAKKEGTSIFSFNTQVKFALQEQRLGDIFRAVATSKENIQTNVVKFLNEWEGVPGNKVQQRVDFANQWLETIKKAMGEKATGEDTKINDQVPDADPKQVTSDGGAVNYRVTVPADLDRFQRWFIKIIVSNINQGDNGSASVISPLLDAQMYITATNSKTGKTVNMDITPIMKKKWACDWIGSNSSSAETIYPNDDPMEGFDIMDLAWYLNDDERDALYSAGEKIFTIKALGSAKVTLRNFLKFSHIN